MRPPAPVARVRARLARELGAATAAALPPRYERLGRVLVLRLPEALRPAYPAIARAYADELGVEAVLRSAGPVAGEWRRPEFELLLGDSTRTEVVEHGVRYGFDPREVMFARGNKTERARLGALVRDGERVIDLFAGIGYFTLPAARAGPNVRVTAVEANPVAFGWLRTNLAANRVEGRVLPLLGDNRESGLPVGEADRVVLGYLPSSVPWVPLASSLLRPAGGVLHVHLLANASGAEGEAAATVEEAVARSGGTVRSAEGRVVKSYGPSRVHAVVDAVVQPAAP